MIGEAFSAKEQALSAFAKGSKNIPHKTLLIQRCFWYFLFYFKKLNESHIKQ